MTIHIVMMSKGGVGKSLVAILLAQYLKARGRAPYCIDTDPVSGTFHSYRELEAEHIDVMADDMSIDLSRFDPVIERLIEHPGDCVVDTGPSTFFPLLGYLARNDVFALLKSYGKRVIIHAPIVGGQGMDATIRGLCALLQFRTSIIVWENDYFGPVEKDGRRFEKSEIFRSAGGQIIGVAKLFQRDPDTRGKDISLMTTRRLTFATMMELPEILLIQRRRYARAWQQITHTLNQIGI